MKLITLFLYIVPYLLFSLELKIANYNVENLFDDVNNGTEYQEYIPNSHNWTKEVLNKKLSNITKVICDLNPDIIGLEEIENSHALELLQNNLNNSGCKYPYSAITERKGSSIQVAILSKYKIKNSKDIIVSNNPHDRDILEVDIDVKPKLKIFVNHWRSKSSPESQRVKYAKALINRIKTLPPNSEYIIIGDFNSKYNECVDIDSKNNDTNGTCGIDTILQTFYKGKFLKLRDKLNKNIIYHYNLWSEVSAHKRWSHDFYGDKEAIDSIIIPPSLNDNEGWFYKKGSFNIFKKSYLFKKDKKNMLNRWEYKHQMHTGFGYSDHLPIYAIFCNGIVEKKHEILLDKFWKFILSIFGIDINDTKKVKNDIKTLTLSELIDIKYLKEPIILKDVCVIFKRGDIGVIKSSPNSKTITLYKSAENLKEGKCYDLKVYKKDKYYGLDEITDLDIQKEKNSINTEEYISKFNINKLNNYKLGDIVKDIEGIYNKRYLDINGMKVKIYSKVKKRGLFRKNNHLYIKKAQIGEYKGEKELIIYSLKDINVVE